MAAEHGDMQPRPERRRVVGRLLRKLRTEANLRQEDLAAALGRPQSFVSKYESGEQSLDMIEVAEVCRSVGIGLPAFAELLERDLQTKE